MGCESNFIDSFFFLNDYSSAMRNIELIVKIVHIFQKLMCNFLCGFQTGKLHNLTFGLIFFPLFASNFILSREKLMLFSI
jgi:hypothetical protein